MLIKEKIMKYNDSLIAQKYIYIKKTPKDNIYFQLIDLMFDLSDSFILVERPEMDTSENFTRIMSELSGYLIKMQNQTSFAQTSIMNSFAKVYYFKICEETKAILLKYSNSLYDWVQPNLPENICFSSNGRYLLTSKTQEQNCTLFIYYPSLHEKIKKLDI